MSIRIESHGFIPVENGDRKMQEVMVYVSTVREAQEVDTSGMVMGSLLFVINEGKSYMLNGDGAEGEWRAVTDGAPLSEEVDLLVE